MTERKTIKCIKPWGTAELGKEYAATLRGKQIFIDNLPVWTSQPILVLRDGVADNHRHWKHWELLSK
jgi:hypothetical protein